MARQTLNRLPKFAVLCRVLGLPRAVVRGHLELMWDCAHETGNPVFDGVEEVEAAAEWDGEPGALVAALTRHSASGKPGWLDLLPNGCYEIHHYWDHCPEYVKKRAHREIERRKNGSQFRDIVTNGRQSADVQETVGNHSGAARQPTAAERHASHLPSPAPTPIAPQEHEPDAPPTLFDTLPRARAGHSIPPGFYERCWVNFLAARKRCFEVLGKRLIPEPSLGDEARQMIKAAVMKNVADCGGLEEALKVVLECPLGLEFSEWHMGRGRYADQEPKLDWRQVYNVTTKVNQPLRLAEYYRQRGAVSAAKSTATPLGFVNGTPIIPPPHQPIPVRNLQRQIQDIYRERFRAGDFPRATLDARLVEVQRIEDREELYQILDRLKEQRDQPPGSRMADTGVGGPP